MVRDGDESSVGGERGGWPQSVYGQWRLVDV